MGVYRRQEQTQKGNTRAVIEFLRAASVYCSAVAFTIFEPYSNAKANCAVVLFLFLLRKAVVKPSVNKIH